MEVPSWNDRKPHQDFEANSDQGANSDFEIVYDHEPLHDRETFDDLDDERGSFPLQIQKNEIVFNLQTIVLNFLLQKVLVWDRSSNDRFC